MLRVLLIVFLLFFLIRTVQLLTRILRSRANRSYGSILDAEPRRPPEEAFKNIEDAHFEDIPPDKDNTKS